MPTKGAQRIIRILCDRDGCTYSEAKERVSEATLRMAECSYDPIECEDIMAEVLGLEMDYIFDLLM